MTVDAGKTTSTATGFDLTAGTRYKIEVSGTITDTNPNGMGFNYDALYCYGGFGFLPDAGPQCQPPSLNANVYVGIGSAPLEHLDAHELPSGDTTNQTAYAPAYSPSHTYTVDYWPQGSGELMAGGDFAYSGCKTPTQPNTLPCQDTIFGTFTIQVFAPSSGGTGGTGSTGATGTTGATGSTGASAGSSTCLHLPNSTKCAAVLLSALTVAGQTTTFAAPSPGDSAVTQILGFGGAADENTNIGGLSAQDYAVLEGAKHDCYIKFTGQLAYILASLTTSHKNAVKQAKTRQEVMQLEAEYAQLDIPFVEIGLKGELEQCVAFVEAVEVLGAAGKLAADTGHAAASSCQMTAVSLSVGGSGSKPRLKSFKLIPANKQSLNVTCSTANGQLAISAATRSGQPLSSVLGSAIGLGIVRSPADSPGGTLSLSYTTQGAMSGPPDITGGWVNQATPNAGPPWQLTTSNNLQTLDVAWTGGAGHTGLHGTFHGSLSRPNGVYTYTGAFTITEGATTVTGTMSVAIDSPNQIEISLQPSTGSPQHYTFVRKS